ncbi:TlyA family RNA methyltransferase [Microbacterium betulae]|uniref:TlyA family RNA methyltransferase n=1 Tax=Microbacterium betulae TaxID=2981139 RepID=A0AA97FE90_9MICO|nr:TlyA family RNA methyltransferase [Microbacterium sp. AB]WOF21971.1 TlyA family RNA methyltransferase [Microbacterium sp. AB]
MTQRLDAALAERGLVRSRTHAAALIADAAVRVDGRVVTKPSTRVEADSDLQVDAADDYVSRGAHKLVAALDAFSVVVDGRLALDMGASTGGFTQVLRERGAAPVIAADVGHDQLSPSVAADPGVHALEGYNVRFMTPESLARASGVDDTPAVITGDLSFISLTHVLPAVSLVAAPGADVLLLVKPQFEVGRTGVRGGVVVDPVLRVDAVRTVLAAAWAAGLGTLGVRRSPLEGSHGNVEVLVHISPGRGSDPTEWEDAIAHEGGGR